MYITPIETYALKLRDLYITHGFKPFRMRRFEEYDFYADKKDFLASNAILTFTDLNGKLMALRPDVTLSLIKRGIQGKYCYNENVYRPDENTNTFGEIQQSGLDVLGTLTDEATDEVITLAVESLKLLADGKDYTLNIADAGKVAELLSNYANKSEILRALSARNINALKKLNAPEELISLLGAINPVSKKNIEHTRTDYSIVRNISYYNGLVFNGYIEGNPYSVLSGGQYDGILRTAHSQIPNGLGFAINLDRL